MNISPPKRSAPERRPDEHMAAAMATTAAAAAEEAVVALDKETLMLMGCGDAPPAAPCAEWETFKENVRPLKRGRNVGLLNRALKAHADPAQRAALLAARRYRRRSRHPRLSVLGFGLLWIS